MTIEFDTSYKKVPESLINKIRDEMLRLSHLNKNISKAEIFLIEDKTAQKKDNKVCEIRLSVDNDDDLFVNARTAGFEESSKEAIKDLEGLVKQHIKDQEELPDDLISTVKV